MNILKAVVLLLVSTGQIWASPLISSIKCVRKAKTNLNEVLSVTTYGAITGEKSSIVIERKKKINARNVNLKTSQLQCFRKVKVLSQKNSEQSHAKET